MRRRGSRSCRWRWRWPGSASPNSRADSSPARSARHMHADGADGRAQARLPGFTLDAEFAVPAAGVTALCGPSGAGKSTIIAATAGLLRPDAGRIAIGETVLMDTG